MVTRDDISSKMNMLILPTFFILASISWILFVVYSWLFWHLYEPSDEGLFSLGYLQYIVSDPSFVASIAPILTIAMAYLLIAFWWKIRFSYPITITPKWVFLAFISLVYFFYFSATSIQPLPNLGIPLVRGTEIISLLLPFSLNIASILFWMTLLLLTSFSAGKFLLERLLMSPIIAKDHLSDVLVTICAGFLTLSILALGIGSLGLLTRPIVVSIFLFFIISGWKPIFTLLKDFLLYFNTQRLLIVPLSLPVSLGIFLACFVAMDIIDHIRPIPTGFDSLTYYVNRSSMIAERAEIVPGGIPFPGELLMALPYILFSEEPFIATSTNLLYAILGSLVAYTIGKDIFGRRAGLLGAVFWYTLPMATFLNVSDIKVDHLLLFSSLISLLLFLRFVETGYRPFLLSAALFLGFSFTIKVSAIFSVLSILISACMMPTFRKRVFNQEPRYTFHLGLLSILFFFLPVLPWSLYALSTQDKLSFSHPFQTLVSQGRGLTENEIDELSGINRASCVFTQREEDLGRFRPTHSSLQDFLKTPWTTTMNAAVSNPGSEIGFLILALLPIFLIARLLVKTHTTRTTSIAQGMLSLLVFTHLILWIAFGSGVPWYGIVAFAGLLILLSGLLVTINLPTILGTCVIAATALSLSIHMLYRASNFGNNAALLYAGERISSENFIDLIFPGQRVAFSSLLLDGSERILRSAGAFHYFIRENDRVVISDSTLDLFSCLNKENDPELTLSRLHNLSIRYIAISPEIVNIQTQQNNPIRVKFHDFKIFADNFLKPHTKRAGAFEIYEVPNIITERNYTPHLKIP